MTISRGFHPSVENRTDRVNKAKNEMPFRGAIFSKVTTGASDSERVTVASTTGTRTINFSYPFASRNAWIRGQPEESTTMLSIIGGDTFDLQPVSYFDSAKSGAAKAHRDKSSEIRDFPSLDLTGTTLPYRTLSPGELDIASRFSQLFLGKNDVFQARGGLSTLSMNSLENRHSTPLWSVKGPASVLDANGSLNDEMRFGTVRRAVSGSSTPTNQSLVISDQIHTGTPGNPVFAKEHTMVLSWFGTPNKLLDHRQGIVVDDSGKNITNRQSGRDLRAHFQWFSDNSTTSAEIDDAGNTSVQVSDDATSGFSLAVPSGDLNISVGGGDTGGHLQVKSSKDTNLSSDKRFSIVAAEGFSFHTKQRGIIRGQRSLSLKSEGNISLETPQMLGVKVGLPSKTKYPALVAHPDYLSTLNNYFTSQSALSSAVMSYGINAALAWSSIGPLTMLLDPSGTVMGMCLAAAASASQLAQSAPSVTTAVTQHLPRMSQMPNGFMSKKLAAE